jgi:hypothetical protein
MAPKLNHN